MRFFLDIAYKGTAFHGWQQQPNALTVQEVLQTAISTVLREPVELTGSGRTDTGVHAAQQIAHLDITEPLTEELIFRINCVLPREIAIKDFFRVKPDAHARFDALSREYEYRLRRKKDPFLSDFACYFSRPLNLEAMNRAASVLLRHKDFQSFSKVHTSVENFKCDVAVAEWLEREGLIVFHVKANRFLRGMVRALVGTMLTIGMGKQSPEVMEDILNSRDRRKAGAAAPPEGLFLTRVNYPSDIFLSGE